MRELGFVNHTVSGALILGFLWSALYLPNLGPAARLGGWAGGLALGAFAAGSLAGPVVLFFLGGDEIVAFLGLVAALVLGWSCARVSASLGVAPPRQELVRLCAAALGPPLLLGVLKTVFWYRDRER